MSSVSLSRGVEMTVEADAGTEFVVTNGDRARVRSGRGNDRFTLEPGIYKIRFMAGGRYEERLFEVEDHPVTQTAPELEFASPVPLSGTSTSHEFHQQSTHDMFAAEPEPFGKGSDLAILVRDSATDPINGPPTEPWRDMSVERLWGETSFDLDSTGMRDAKHGFAFARATVAPDTYLVSVARKNGPALQMPVVALPGWRSTVFLDCAGARGEREPDLYGASVVMSESTKPFNSQDHALRMAELAKIAIQRERPTVEAAELGRMLEAKFDYPMLGILAAHVLLLEKELRVHVLQEVVGNLQHLVPGHPDVIALNVALLRRIGHE